MPAPHIPHYVAVKVGDDFVLVNKAEAQLTDPAPLWVGGSVAALLALLGRGLPRLILTLLAGALFTMAAHRQRARAGSKSRRGGRDWQSGPTFQHETPQLRSSQHAQDEVDEAVMESFPASDPPARMTPQDV